MTTRGDIVGDRPRARRHAWQQCGARDRQYRAWRAATPRGAGGIVACLPRENVARGQASWRKTTALNGVNIMAYGGVAPFARIEQHINAHSAYNGAAAAYNALAAGAVTINVPPLPCFICRSMAALSSPRINAVRHAPATSPPP